MVDEDRSPERIEALTAPITDDDLYTSLEIFRRVRVRAQRHFRKDRAEVIVEMIDKVIDSIEALLKGQPTELTREQIMLSIRQKYWN